MARLRYDFQQGTLSSPGLTDVGTTMTSAELAGLPAVTAPDYLALTLDGPGVAGDPEIVWVTAHTAGVTTATILREQEGTVARAHNAGRTWTHAPTAEDWGLVVPSPDTGNDGVDAQFPTTRTIQDGPSYLGFVNTEFTGDDGTRLYIMPRTRPTVTDPTGGFLKIFSDPFHEQTELTRDYLDLGLGYSREFGGDEGRKGVGFMVINIKANGPSYDDVDKWPDLIFGFQDGGYPAGRICFEVSEPTRSVWIIGSEASKIIDESIGTLLEVQGGIGLTRESTGGDNREIRWADDNALSSYRNAMVFTDDAMQVLLDAIQTHKAKTGGSFVVGPELALATTATIGFLELPSTAGAPTGTPTPDTGKVPVVVDTTAKQLKGYVGGAWTPLAPAPVVASTEADAGSANSTAEQTLCTLATPTGLAAGDRLIVRVGGDMLNNTGGAVTFTFRFKLGATTVITSNASSVPTAANRRKWSAELEIALVSTSSERVMGPFTISSGTNNELSLGTVIGGDLYGMASEDLTTSKNAVLTVQMGTADPNADCILRSASLTHLRKV